MEDTNIGNYFQPEIECASQDQIRAWQDERLVKQVRHVYDYVEMYRKRMDEKGLKPEDIKGVEDLHKLPFRLLFLRAVRVCFHIELLNNFLANSA